MTTLKNLTAATYIILQHMARALFVMAYADAIEMEELPSDLPQASNGANWMHVAPESDCAFAAATYLALVIEDMNDGTLYQLYRRAVDVEGRHSKSPTMEEFGFCLAMEALGTGVSWTDDHPDAGIEVPRVATELVYDCGTKKFTLEMSNG